MMCFICIGDQSLRIELIEEIIRYSAYRKHGVHVGTNLVLTLTACEDRNLYLIHRRTLDGCRLATIDELEKDKEKGFPYSYIFRNILEDRVRNRQDGTLNIRLAPDGETTVEGVRLIAPENGTGFHLEEVFSYPSPSERGNAPFTCLRIGPFPNPDRSYLLRFECHIGEPSFGDLIPEDLETGTRIYKVYGPDHVRKCIESYDIPQCSVRSDPSAFREHVEFFGKIDPKRIIMPSRYQIIAVDNPNCNPRRLQALDLTNDLRDITSQIRPSFYDDDPVLRQIRGRLHWFTSNAPRSGFFLQLSGPMALAELCALQRSGPMALAEPCAAGR
jgi:hypothetical protein